MFVEICIVADPAIQHLRDDTLIMTINIAIAATGIDSSIIRMSFISDEMLNKMFFMFTATSLMGYAAPSFDSRILANFCLNVESLINVCITYF